ncbi:hypothetical protein XthCFBP4691_20175 [Xanthomonas theicola]|uniref:Dermonecrotic toxin N-terminal domain-containing protein n=2 Tax=Xanthomonas theicola TaxID=56464 RepID=A0A2S6YZC7_9XANT|nr:hypothetical protein XthCFBP4691_20175 [Xanthomonas theicola]
MQMARRDTPSVGLDVAAIAGAVTGGLTSGLKSVIAALHQAGQFVRRYDPLTLPGAQALPAGGHHYTGKQGDELIIIRDVYGKVVDLSRDYYPSANLTEPYHFVRTGLKALAGFYEDYNSKYLGLKSLARSILKEEIRRHFHLDIDPDKTQFIHFHWILYTVFEKIQYSDRATKKTLTEWLFSNFDASTQMNLQDVDAMCGIYDISLDGRKEYRSTDAIPVPDYPSVASLDSGLVNAASR